MRSRRVTGLLAVLVLVLAAPALARPASGPGEVTVDTDVSQWNVGSGQPNGEFVTAERLGIEIGLRAQERFTGPLEATASPNGKVGVYQASVGSTGGNNATWNYDFHVDVSGARGVARGTTLDDYRLELEQDFTDQSLFGVLGAHPVSLPLGEEPDDGVCSADTVSSTLCQQSWNPGFGNDDFDPTVPGTYHLRLVLTPETFDNPPLAVAIEVDVSE